MCPSLLEKLFHCHLHTDALIHLRFFWGEATGSVVNPKAWVSRGYSEDSLGQVRIPKAKFLPLKNTQRECKKKKKKSTLLKLEKVNAGRCFRVLVGTVLVGIYEVIHPSLGPIFRTVQAVLLWNVEGGQSSLLFWLG